MNFPAEPKIANWMKESRLSKVCRNTAVHCPAHHTTEGVKNICMNFHNIPLLHLQNWWCHLWTTLNQKQSVLEPLVVWSCNVIHEPPLRQIRLLVSLVKVLCPNLMKTFSEFCVLRNFVDTFTQHTTASFCMKLKIAGNFEILHFAPPAAWHQRNFIIFPDRVVIGGRFYAKQSAFCHVGRLQFRRFAEQNLKLIQVRTLTTPWQKWIFKVSNYTRNSTF